MFCSKCGAKLEDNMEFCPNCGTKVVKAAPIEDSLNNRVNVTNESNENKTIFVKQIEEVTIQDVEREQTPKLIIGGILGLLFSLLGTIISFVIIALSNNTAREYYKQHPGKPLTIKDYSKSYRHCYYFYIAGIMLGVFWPTILTMCLIAF